MGKQQTVYVEREAPPSAYEFLFNVTAADLSKRVDALERLVPVIERLEALAFTDQSTTVDRTTEATAAERAGEQ